MAFFGRTIGSAGLVIAAGAVAALGLSPASPHAPDARGPDIGVAPGGRLDRIVTIPPTEQADGDADAGLEYLLYGDYIGSGYPPEIYALMASFDPDPQPATLGRRGTAADIPDTMNAFTMPNGVEVISGANCLACHAQRFGDEFVIGMGNSLADWTAQAPPGLSLVRNVAALRLGIDSPEFASFDQYFRGVMAIAGNVGAPFKGVNPAFRLEEVSAARRSPHDLSWTGGQTFAISDRFYAADPPPLWNIDKKHALYYTGLGRGDFAKLIQQIGMVGMGDATDAARVAESMPDLMAYLKTLEPPTYPGTIDAELAAAGAEVFANTCVGCHGTYDSPAVPSDGPETYPNKLVPISTVKTDPHYARMVVESGLPGWFNESWYAKTEPRAWAVPAMGYVAPPLDGVWSTAPYLHNGSVPTLDTLLDSSKRPERWTRTFDPNDYDLDRVGWAYTEPIDGEPGTLNTYDTRIEGYSNEGHLFGDDLTEFERRALIEYLKTL